MTLWNPSRSCQSQGARGCGQSRRLRARNYTVSMALRLLAATTSQGKLGDFRVAAEAHPVLIEPLPGLKGIPAPKEDGTTFRANAALKAAYYSRFAPGQLVLADDSGLEVDALQGAPGVRSARFAADAGLFDSPDAPLDNTDVWNNMILLQRLEGVPAGRRTARYHCVLAVARDGELIDTADGSVEGQILEAPRGTGGFGYDPLFYLPHLDRTMAEIDLETKLRLSHRGVALTALISQLVD
jgi:XTP/dITP diphosphohydrolase